MKIIKTASKMSLKLSKGEWLAIGKTAGWTKSQEELDRLEISKQEAVKIANDIKIKLEEIGYKVPNIDIKDKIWIKTITDGDGRCHNCDIELKPWANKINEMCELKSGVIIMAGPYAHRRFRRRRFSPQGIDKLINFLKQIFKYTINMENIRKKRSEKAEQMKIEKLEAAMQNKLKQQPQVISN